MKRACAVFLLSAAWFAVFIPWHGFADPDAFYHAKAAELLLTHGPIRSFPWLDLTLLGSSFADLHFGFHLLTAPCVKLFGMFMGLRVATVLFAALAVATFYAALRWLKIRGSLFWTSLLLLSHAFAFRILLGKATPLAIALFLFGLTAAWKRKPRFVALASAAFALTHGGWVTLAGSVALIALGDVIYSRVVEDAPWKLALQKSLWRETLAAWAGGIAGMILHPNFPNVFRFAWAQVVTIGLGTPFAHVVLGTEWLPADPAQLFVSLSPWIIALLSGIVGLLFTFAAGKMTGLDSSAAADGNDNTFHGRARLVASLGCLVAVLLALTLKSRRMVEYLIPVLALWCAAIWEMADVRRLREEFRLTRFVRFVLVACVIAVIGKQIFALRQEFHPARYSDDAYASALSAISERAVFGDRVFHSSWDEFPMLFAHDDRLRYVSGLDPTFLYIASSTLSDAYRDVTCPECRDLLAGKPPIPVATSTWQGDAWRLIHDRLGAKFVFVTKANHPSFLRFVQNDPRYEQIFDATDSAAFEVRP